MEALLVVVKHNGPTMFARIGVMRALNRHVERVFNPSRNDKRPTSGESKMDLLTPALGAIVGFSLAQFANIAQMVWASATAAKLKIDDLGTGCRSLTHYASDNPDVRETVYAAASKMLASE